MAVQRDRHRFQSQKWWKPFDWEREEKFSDCTWGWEWFTHTHKEEEENQRHRAMAIRFILLKQNLARNLQKHTYTNSRDHQSFFKGRTNSKREKLERVRSWNGLSCLVFSSVSSCVVVVTLLSHANNSGRKGGKYICQAEITRKKVNW